MAADEDWRPIRIRYLAVFTPKLAGDEYDKSDNIDQGYLGHAKSKVTTKGKIKEEAV
jgi:hypothetical protein